MNNNQRVTFPTNWLKDCWRIVEENKPEVEYDKPESKPKLTDWDKYIYKNDW